MKIKIIPILLALCCTGLIVAGYQICHAGAGVTVFAALAAALTLGSMLGLDVEGRAHETVVFRMVCGMLFTATFVINIVFAALHTGIAWVALVNAAVLVVWLFALYGTVNKK